MSIFKAALRLAARHRVYFLIYLVALSLCGLPMVLSSMNATADVRSAGHKEYLSSGAVIERDGSAISRGLTAHVSQTAELVEVADETYAIQDALAQSHVDGVVVIPQGFGQDLMDAAHAGSDAPEVQVAYGTDMQSGTLAMSEATGWLSLAGRAAALDPAADEHEVVSRAEEASQERAGTRATDVQAAQAGTETFTGYLGFNLYALFVTIVVCVGLMMSRFRTPEMRLRNGASPLSFSQVNRSVVGAGLVLTAIAWGWVSALALGFGAGALEGAAWWQVALCLLSLFLYCLVPLAMAFALSQLNASEEMLNAVGNILGLASSFLSGAWVTRELMDSSVQALARLTPGYWCNDVLVSAFTTSDWGALAGRMATDLGMLLLFAVVTALVGAAVSQARVLRSTGSARAARMAE